jgi:hypothetical protein
MNNYYSQPLFLFKFDRSNAQEICHGSREVRFPESKCGSETGRAAHQAKAYGHQIHRTGRNHSRSHEPLASQAGFQRSADPGP